MFYQMNATITPQKWMYIRSLLKTNALLPHDYKMQINQHIFESYSGWATSYGRERYKKRVREGNIQKGDLDIYSLDGLWKAVETYNASYPFYSHAKKCIHWSLYRGIRQMQPFPRDSFDKRMKKPYKPTVTILFDDKLEVSSNREEETKKSCIQEIRLWQMVSTLEPFVVRIFHYKYDFEFNVIRSNKEVAELMCCCEEHVRTILKQETQMLLENMKIQT
jgi:RNA polymerase sigma factor (sigma-70 family)